MSPVVQNHWPNKELLSLCTHLRLSSFHCTTITYIGLFSNTQKSLCSFFTLTSTGAGNPSVMIHARSSAKERTVQQLLLFLRYTSFLLHRWQGSTLRLGTNHVTIPYILIPNLAFHGNPLHSDTGSCFHRNSLHPEIMFCLPS